MEYFATDYAEFSSAENNNNGGGGHFMVDDLLDFSKAEETTADTFVDGMTMDSGDYSAIPRVESCNSSISGGGETHFNRRSVNEPQFPANELCVPYEEIAELEWLSNFVEESFSTDDLRFVHPTNPSSQKAFSAAADASSSITTRTSPPTPPSIFHSDVSVPGKARSKRSRAPPCDWSSRLLHVAAPQTTPAKKRDPPPPPPPPPTTTTATGAPPRKCLHCQSEKTPQWRTGPMGPKTLCNACGVRFKSGRLVPEYRPAASPTFISNKHSNSHRKVLELRRQKDIQRQQQHHQHVPTMFNGCDAFLIHHHHHNNNGQDLRHII